MEGTENHERARLHPFTRPRYWYGKLITVHDMNLARDYAEDKRLLINEFVLGPGVLDGLEAQNVERKITVGPGVAISPGGRELILATERDLTLTDDLAALAKDEQRHILLVITRHDIPDDPVPGYRPGLDKRQELECNVLREGCRLDCRELKPASRTHCRELMAGVLHRGALGTGGQRYDVDDDAVVLARVLPAKAGLGLDSSVRRWIPQPARLLDATRCLTHTVLRCGLGDNQTAAPGAVLEHELAVQLVCAGDPLDGRPVTFRVRGPEKHAGTLWDFEKKAWRPSVTLKTCDGGHAATYWRLGHHSGGQHPGLASVEALAEPGGRVEFRALVEPVETFETAADEIEDGIEAIIKRVKEKLGLEDREVIA